MPVHQRFSLLIATIVPFLQLPMPVSACDWCMPRHRTGSLAVKLATDAHVYRLHQPIYLRMTVTNNGSRDVLVDATSMESQVALHLRTPESGISFPDKPRSVLHGTRLAPGRSVTFPPTPITRWGHQFEQLGKCELNVSYGGVDSNTVTWRVLPAN